MDLNIAYDMAQLRTYQKPQNQVAFPLDTFHGPEQYPVLHSQHKPLHTKAEALRQE
jgi:hypothetical protein